MKKVIFITLVATFLFTGCSKSKESQCDSAMSHMVGLLENDPDMKKMGPEILKKMKEGFEKEKNKRLKECVEKFDQKEVDCIMGLKSLKDAGKCDLKK
jgi:diphthamide synthase (EF-2-diphthine--ammonia ligase)